MENMYYTLESLKSYVPESRYRTIGNDFFLTELDQKGNSDFMKYPMRFNGYAVFYCIEGKFTLDMNLKSFEVSEGSLFIFAPDSIAKVSVNNENCSDAYRFIVAAASQEFISSTRNGINRLYDEILISRNIPCIMLGDSEKKLLRQYYELTSSLLALGMQDGDDALKSLCSSAFSMFGSIWRSRLALMAKDGTPKKSRHNMVFEDFVKLVSQHHKAEHNVAFYADMLMLTPKYLSKVVKEVSGKSAPELIDSFLILEAKNLLKYSDMSIKEISFNLHFSTVPSFYKFFHKQAGMTPADYRKL